MLSMTALRKTGALLLVMPAASVLAGQGQGTLLVSATVVDTCAVSLAPSGSALVSCPQNAPYRLSVAPAATGQVVAADSTQITHSGETRLALEKTVSTEQRQLSAVAGDNAMVTVLTVSY